MDIYIVGGYVRDLVLGHTPHDADYVVTGVTADEFEARYPGILKTGNHFPVYQFRVDGEVHEVAIGRKETKVGFGHTEFSFEITDDITEDLARRDLTCNAMALPVNAIGDQPTSLDGLLDPFNGCYDIQNKLLRHTSPAFIEDPLRVLRLARFAATFGFGVDASTVEICKQISSADLLSLPGERIEKEMTKAMGSKNPTAFFNAMEISGALSVLLPEISVLRSVPAGPIEYHPEGDSLTHTLMVLDEAIRLGANIVERYAALFHDVGKATTDPALYPLHRGHDCAGVPIVEAISKRLRLPANVTKASIMAADLHMKMHKFHEMRPAKQIAMVLAAKRNPLGCNGLALVSEADSRGRAVDKHDVQGPDRMRQIADAIIKTKMPEGTPANLAAQRMLEERIRTVKRIK